MGDMCIHVGINVIIDIRYLIVHFLIRNRLGESLGE